MPSKTQTKTQESSKLTLPKKPTLADFQRYVADMVQERGFENENLPEVFMLFLEECGELAKAVRKQKGMRTDLQSKTFEVSHEMADVFIYLLDIANHLGVDLEAAFRQKEEINKGRVWKVEKRAAK